MKTANKIALGTIAAVSALYGTVMPTIIPSVFATGEAGIERTASTKHDLELITNLPAGTMVFADGEFDEINKIHDATMTVTVNEDVMNIILNQTPGIGSSLGNFYVGIKMKNLNQYFEKSGAWYYTNTNPTIAEQQAKARVQLTTNQKDSNDTMWTQGVLVQYKDGNTWKTSTTAGNGALSIRQDLTNKSGVAPTALNYGQTWRIFMVTDQTNIIVWQDKKLENGNYVNDDYAEYVRINFKIEFPVAANFTGYDVYYPTIQNALENSNATELTVHKDLIVYEDLTIPEGVSLTVTDGAKITLAHGVELTNKGSINAPAGAIVNSKNTNLVYNVDVNGEYGGPAIVGQEVSVNIGTKRAGYVFIVKAQTAGGEDIAIENGKFIMPADDVIITSGYEAIAFTSGDGAVYTLKDGEDLTFTLNGDFEEFDHFTIDDEEIASENYEVKKGSTIITLKKAYLDTLDAGDHSLTAFYTDGTEVTATFAVKTAETNETPNTGRATTGNGSASAFLTATIIGMTTSIVAFAVALIKRRQA